MSLINLLTGMLLTMGLIVSCTDSAPRTTEPGELPDNPLPVKPTATPFLLEVSRMPVPSPSPVEPGPTSMAEPEPPRWVLDLIGIVPFEILDDMAILEIRGKDYAIRAASNMILIVDISNPTRPVEVSSLDLRGNGPGTYNSAAIGIWGHYAFVVTQCSNISSSKIISIDVSIPEFPKIIGQSDCFPAPSRNISILQGRAYMVVVGGIKVFDITTPSLLKLVGSLETEGVVFGMDNDGRNVYVAAWLGNQSSKLLIIDGADPAPSGRPTSILFATPNYNGGLRIRSVDGRVYILQKGDLSKLVVHVVDAATPANPQIVGNWEIETPQGDTLCHPEIVGGYLYVPTPTHQGSLGWSTKLLAVQLANLSVPPSSSWQKMANWVGCSDAEARGNLLVLASTNGMSLLDVSDPAAVQDVGSFNRGTRLNGGAVSGSFAYVTTREHFIVVDASVPDSPQVVGSLWFPDSGWLGDVAISGAYAYVGGSPSRVIDVSDPSSPHEVAVIEVRSSAGVHLQESLLYINGWSGMVIVDVSEPREPRTVARITGSISLNGWVVRGDHLYMLGNIDELEGDAFAVFDVSRSGGPQVLGSVPMPAAGQVCNAGGCRHLVQGVLNVTGRYAYVATKGDSPALMVIDVSDHSSPVVVGTTPIKHDRFGLPFRVANIAVQGHLAVLVGQTGDAGSAKGVSIIDISNPEQPKEIGEYPGALSSIALDLPVAYAAGQNTSVLLDLSVPAEPRLVASVGVGGKIIATSDPMLYILVSSVRGFAIVRAISSSTSMPQTSTRTSTPPVVGQVRSIAGRVVGVNIGENSFVVLQPREERSFTVRLEEETEFIRLVFPFDVKNPPSDATFTPERELITIEDLHVGEQVFVRSSHAITTGEDILRPLEVQVLP